MAKAPVKKENGTYPTLDLSEKEFMKRMNHIQKVQNKARRDAKRTLKLSTMRNPTPKALKALGDKVKGVGFTKQDLIDFDKSRDQFQKKVNHKQAGITYGEIVKYSRQIDIKRANNQVNDGKGITSAALAGIKANEVYVRVKASMESEHEEHRVRVRFEEWDQQMLDPIDDDITKVIKHIAGGRVSFDCDCGRHQYWYRYLATIGNYALAPPKEFSFPKIKNPELSGVACKHVLKSMAMLQSPAWHRLIGKRMSYQMKRVGFGDDKKTTSYLTTKEKKAAAKNRSTKVNVDKAKREYNRYLKASKGFEQKVKQRGTDAQLIKRQAKKIRKAESRAEMFSDIIKLQFQTFSDGYTAQGRTREEALNDFAKQSKVSVSAMRKIVK